MAQYEILEFLKKNKGKKYSSLDLEKQFDITNVAVNNGLKQLVKFGYIKMERQHFNKYKYWTD